MRCSFRLTVQRGLLVIGMVGAGAAPAVSQITVVPDTSRVLRATGRASITTVPDVATVTLGVRVADADARRAKTSVDAAISKIVSLAKGLKVPDGDLRTAAVNIEARSDPDNPTRSRGYEVTRSVTVVLKRLEDLDALLDGAVQAGANSDFDVELTSSRADDLKREAISRALADARTQANAAAEQLGVRVVSVRSIDLEGAGRSSTGNASTSYASGPPPARFLPGLIKVSAEIPVVFVIDDKR